MMPYSHGVRKQLLVRNASSRPSGDQTGAVSSPFGREERLRIPLPSAFTRKISMLSLTVQSRRANAIGPPSEPTRRSGSALRTAPCEPPAASAHSITASTVSHNRRRPTHTPHPRASSRTIALPEAEVKRPIRRPNDPPLPVDARERGTKQTTGCQTHEPGWRVTGSRSYWWTSVGRRSLCAISGRSDPLPPESAAVGWDSHGRSAGYGTLDGADVGHACWGGVRYPVDQAASNAVSPILLRRGRM